MGQSPLLLIFLVHNRPRSCQNNHIMNSNWEASEIVEQESDKLKRWIKESICIRLNTPIMNRDEGAYQLSPIWTQVISAPKPGGEGVSTE